MRWVRPDFLGASSDGAVCAKPRARRRYSRNPATPSDRRNHPESAGITTSSEGGTGFVGQDLHFSTYESLIQAELDGAIGRSGKKTLAAGDGAVTMLFERETFMSNCPHCGASLPPTGN